jgi:hypothetical protein
VALSAPQVEGRSKERKVPDPDDDRTSPPPPPHLLAQHPSLDPTIRWQEKYEKAKSKKDFEDGHATRRIARHTPGTPTALRSPDPHALHSRVHTQIKARALVCVCACVCCRHDKYWKEREVRDRKKWLQDPEPRLPGKYLKD